jgi:hypothetical protein
MLLSDKGLEDETPESDAHDLTEDDRTIFGAASSGEGDVDEIIVPVDPIVIVVFISDGYDEAVASK